MKKKEIKINLSYYLISAIIGFLGLVFLFKHIRALILPPIIGEEEIIGFAQYFGYPLNFENFYLLVLLSVPLWIVLIFYILKRK